MNWVILSTSFGEMDIDVPRDRKGEFEPQIIQKHQTVLPNAIAAVYPKTELQQCIIHQIRNTTKFVSYNDLKALMADLKRAYAAPKEETALLELDLFEDKWKQKYSKIAVS
jgi:transposase-like protein